jgi:hypothetical protein
MILISHRGNLNGKNPKMENRPSYIKQALNQGFNCEIDLWNINNKWYLGHDEPKIKVTYNWLVNNSYGLWVHCKNIEAINKLVLKNGKNIRDNNINYFWHENDKLTLTSKGYIWASPTRIAIPNSIVVAPEKRNTILKNCLGICSDFIINYANI